MSGLTMNEVLPNSSYFNTYTAAPQRWHQQICYP